MTCRKVTCTLVHLVCCATGRRITCTLVHRVYVVTGGRIMCTLVHQVCVVRLVVGLRARWCTDVLVAIHCIGSTSVCAQRTSARLTLLAGAAVCFFVPYVGLQLTVFWIVVPAVNLHCLKKQSVTFCSNLGKYCPVLIIFGANIIEKLGKQKAGLFSYLISLPGLKGHSGAD